MNRVALLLTTAVAPVTWGTTYVVTTELLPEGRPLLAAALRTLPAGLLLVALTRTLPRGSWWWRATVLGALNIGAFQALLFVSAYRLPGGVAATFGAAGPLVVAGLAAWLLAEPPTRWRLGWGVAGLVGVALVVLGPEAALDPVGVAAGSLGVLSMAAGTVLTRRWGRPVGLLAYTGWQLALGGLMLAPATLLVEGAPPALDAHAVAGYVWLALGGSVLAYLLWFRGLDSLSAGQAAFLPLLSPVVATLLGWLVLDQQLGAVQGAGFGLALSAVVAAQVSHPRLRAGRSGRAGEAADTMGSCTSRRGGRRSWPIVARARRTPSTRSAPTSGPSTRAPRPWSATSGSRPTGTSSASTTAASTGPRTPAASCRR
jgi:probable blue pigment (indigoidine) exporter